MKKATITVSAVLSDSWAFFRKHFRQICWIIIPVSLPLALFEASLSTLGDNAQIATSFIGFIVTVLIFGALLVQISALAASETLRPGQCYQLALKFWLPLTLITVIETIAIFIGILAFVIPGLIAYARLCFSDIYCIFARGGVLDSVTKSWRQTRPYQWLLLKATALTWLALLIPFFAVQVILGDLGIWNPVFDVVSEVLFLVLSSLLTIFKFRVYTLHRQEALESSE